MDQQNETNKMLLKNMKKVSSKARKLVETMSNTSSFVHHIILNFETRASWEHHTWAIIPMKDPFTMDSATPNARAHTFQDLRRIFNIPSCNTHKFGLGK